VEIPGVANLYFLRTALNAIRRSRGEEDLDAMDFLALAKEKMRLVELDPAFGSRSVNEGFSGGEKKRNEVFQMAVLEPRLAILDEIDSGLDIDALRIVSRGVNALRRQDRGILLVTHYKRLLEYIEPDHIHVMAAGRIVRSGGPELAEELERTGYAWAAGAKPEVQTAGA
jgi:Fe-S cluster assembly ATP-binding protein